MVRTMLAGTDLYMQTQIYCHYYTCITIINSTLLYPQFRNGHLPLAKYLIEDLKCSPTCTDTDGRTPLHLACL